MDMTLPQDQQIYGYDHSLDGSGVFIGDFTSREEAIDAAIEAIKADLDPDVWATRLWLMAAGCHDMIIWTCRFVHPIELMRKHQSHFAAWIIDKAEDLLCDEIPSESAIVMPETKHGIKALNDAIIDVLGEHLHFSAMGVRDIQQHNVTFK